MVPGIQLSSLAYLISEDLCDAYCVMTEVHNADDSFFSKICLDVSSICFAMHTYRGNRKSSNGSPRFLSQFFDTNA